MQPEVLDGLALKDGVEQIHHRYDRDYDHGGPNRPDEAFLGHDVQDEESDGKSQQQSGNHVDDFRKIEILFVYGVNGMFQV